MPISTQQRKSPGGRDLFQMALSGRVEGIEVSRVLDLIVPGGPQAGRLLLVTMEQGTELAPDARTAFATSLRPGGRVGPVPAAIVTPSTVLRVLVNFLVKVVGVPDAAHVSPTEDDALRWLDQVKVPPKTV